MTQPAQPISDYDFIDFGASKGGSLSWAAGAFGGRGIGVDISPAKIQRLTQAGHAGFVADATSLDLPDGSFRYATMMNFLEHLPDRQTGERIIASAVRVSRDFAFILGPNFDEAATLRRLGLKKYFADWSGHTWHHTTQELGEILSGLGHPFKLIEFGEIRHSSHPYLLPLEAGRNRSAYDPALDPPKPDTKIRRGVFGWVAAVVWKNPAVDVADILLKAAGCRVVPVGRAGG
ncbi:class I SAM-dependent methyltransferase [Sediminicoccus rosea]|uniref:Methyltransferase domain-containing protein n=1 Tax=Sediminicoccus rosea TaxID=1225128 RepID=A0ABZ0PCS2_9PROT|nr:methyltransferase domain-containing protein [Sediminicoccus rosea]WPB83402.1 methyltransferase domain-containing protein [Sediminicoccus rosea]